MAVPAQIIIAREEGYYTDQIGKCADGRQFMAFIVASLPVDSRSTDDWQKLKQWHAVLHTFDKMGRQLGSDIWTPGTTADGERAVH